MDDNTTNAVMDESEANEDWEPIEAGAQEVEDMLNAEAAALEQQAEVVDGNVQDILRAVDDLIKLEGVEEDLSNDLSLTFSGGASSDGSIGSQEINDTPPTPTNNDDTPPTQPTQKTRKGSRLQLRKRLRKARQRLKQSSVRATRKLVTGNKETRVRDFVVLPKVVRVLDKYTFTGGILGMLVTEFVMLQYPQYFRFYNVVTMLPLLLLRVVLFKRTKQQYFLLDYCYWVNGLGMLNSFVTSPVMTNLLPAQWQETLWTIFFVSCNGPLFFAMIAWNNSLVFHSVDKVTSTYVHLFPALLSWCERWQHPTSPIYAGDNPDALSWSHHIGYPLAFYILWQVVYLIQTEWWHKPILDADPDLSTSLRYLTTAHKMGVHQGALKLTRALGIMGPTETFTPPTLKVKAIFVILQMIMTLCTFSPVALFYRYQWIHTSVMLGVLSFSLYNGARYYVQVFSKIYDKRYLDEGQPEEEYVDTSAVMSEHHQDKKKEN